jgi:uncharacterized protein with HEPN domain
MKKDGRIYLQDIADAIRRIEHYTAGGKRAFLGDEKTQDAVIRNLAIIGEAVKRLPSRLTRGYPEIPWKQIAGMRDILIHDYSKTSVQTVWVTVQRDLAPLKRVIARMLDEWKS